MSSVITSDGAHSGAESYAELADIIDWSPEW